MSSVFVEATREEGVYVGINDDVAVVYITDAATVDDVEIKDVLKKKNISECHMYKCRSVPHKLKVSTVKRRTEESPVSAEKRRRVLEFVAPASCTMSGEANSREEPQAFHPLLSPTSPAYYPGGVQGLPLEALYDDIYTQPLNLSVFDRGNRLPHEGRSFPSFAVPVIDLTGDDEDSTSYCDSDADAEPAVPVIDLTGDEEDSTSYCDSDADAD